MVSSIVAVCWKVEIVHAVAEVQLKLRLNCHWLLEGLTHVTSTYLAAAAAVYLGNNSASWKP